METVIRLAGAGLSFGAVFAANKLLSAGWRKAIGKEPPTNIEASQEDSVREILGWAILTTLVATGIKIAVGKSTQRYALSMRNPKEV